jgi:7-cyano-7-deazaguanine synthase
MTRAVLLSGGMDSTCIAFWQRPELAITIDYGQRPAAGEIRSAQAISAALGIEHIVVTANIAELGSGDMAGRKPSSEAPASEWWPYRNQFLITVAAMKCHELGATEMMIGALRTDGFHVDSTPAFYAKLNQLLQMQEGELHISTPAIELSAIELIELSRTPEEILAWSHSCHINDIACGFCRGCQKHFETMGAAFGHSY